MKGTLIFAVILAVANAQFPLFPSLGFPYLPPRRYGFPAEDTYAASLGGAPVGLYDKNNFGRYGPYGGGSEVTGASLGGARVGIYGKERPRQSAVPVPIPFPVVRPAYLPFPAVRPYQPPVLLKPKRY